MTVLGAQIVTPGPQLTLTLTEPEISASVVPPSATSFPKFHISRYAGVLFSIFDVTVFHEAPHQNIQCVRSSLMKRHVQPAISSIIYHARNLRTNTPYEILHYSAYRYLYWL